MTTQIRPTPAPDETPAKPKRFGLSWVQIVAAGAASITATTILSFFSISGTLIGAAVFSMASAIGNAVYGQSLRTTKEAVKVVLPVVRADPASPTVVLPTVGSDAAGAADPDRDNPDSDNPDATVPAAEVVDAEPVLPAAQPGGLTGLAWKRVAILAAGIFVFVIAVVTGVELIAGRPLTDVVRGDDNGSGTSLFGGTTGKQIPTMVVTVTPSVTYTTPTVTQPAPTTVTKTATPTVTTTPTATNTPSNSESSSPSSPTSAASSGTSGQSSGATRSSTRHPGR